MTSSDTPPLITVFMPTHNRGRRAIEAARSVLNQTWPALELIIVDDASEPESAKMLDALAAEEPERIRLFRNEINLGAPTSRNRAISAAKGRFITGIDDDDTFLPNRLEVFVSAWREGDAFLYSDDLVCRGPSRTTRWRKADATVARLRARNCVGNQVFTQTKYLQEIGGFDENLLSAQDWDLWLRLAVSKGAGRHIPVATQIFADNLNDDRISNSKRTWRGYYAAYLKIREDLSRDQRKSRLLTIAIARGRRLSPWLVATCLSASTLRIYAREFVRWARKRLTRAHAPVSIGRQLNPPSVR